MTFRMTVVLEYPSVEDAPRIGREVVGGALGNGTIYAVQFGYALKELEVLHQTATEGAKDAAYRASQAFDEET